MHSCGCTGLEDVRRIDVNEAVHIEKREKSFRNLFRSIVVADVRSGDHAGGREPVDVCKRNGGKSQRGTAILIIESGDGLIVIDAKGKRTTPFVFPMYEGGQRFGTASIYRFIRTQAAGRQLGPKRILISANSEVSRLTRNRSPKVSTWALPLSSTMASLTSQ